MQTEPLWLAADWQAPSGIIAGTSLTSSPYAVEGFTLTHHADNPPERALHHRVRLAQACGLSGQWLWLHQTHSDTVIDDDDYIPDADADALISRNPAHIAVVKTADCLPVLLCNDAGDEVAAVHAGWQGLYKNIIGKTIARLHSPPSTLHVWIGPCATQANYEVDHAFYERFRVQDPTYRAFFRTNRPGHYLADLVGIARHQLQQAGIPALRICGGERCSIGGQQYFSYRRDGKRCGHMASFIAPQKH